MKLEFKFSKNKQKSDWRKKVTLMKIIFQVKLVFMIVFIFFYRM